MSARSHELRNLDDLRAFVNETLCGHEQLEQDAFPLTEHVLVRSGAACGIFFCLHGPRAVKFTAIWETQRNTILFYNSNGERFLKIQLVESLAAELCAA